MESKLAGCCFGLHECWGPTLGRWCQETQSMTMVQQVGTPSPDTGAADALQTSSPQSSEKEASVVYKPQVGVLF